MQCETDLTVHCWLQIRNVEQPLEVKKDKKMDLPLEPPKKEGSLADTNPVGFVFLCLGVGIAFAGISILVIVLRYRMKIRKTIYPLDKYAALSLTHKEDFYTTTTTTRTRISSSSDNKRGGR